MANPEQRLHIFLRFDFDSKNLFCFFLMSVPKFAYKLLLNNFWCFYRIYYFRKCAFLNPDFRIIFVPVYWNNFLKKSNIKSTLISTFNYLCNMETVNFTDFRSNLKHWFDKVVNDAGDIIIKRKGGKDLVLVSLDEYNSLKETTYLLTGKNRDILLNSIKELEAGKGIEKDLSV